MTRHRKGQTGSAPRATTRSTHRLVVGLTDIELAQLDAAIAQTGAGSRADYTRHRLFGAEFSGLRRVVRHDASVQTPREPRFAAVVLYTADQEYARGHPIDIVSTSGCMNYTVLLTSGPVDEETLVDRVAVNLSPGVVVLACRVFTHQNDNLPTLPLDIDGSTWRFEPQYIPPGHSPWRVELVVEVPEGRHRLRANLTLGLAD